MVKVCWMLVIGFDLENMPLSASESYFGLCSYLIQTKVCR